MLNKNNLVIAKLASKEENRYVINGVLVKPDCTVVTDGHMLVEVSTPDVALDDVPAIDGITPTREFEPFILSRESAIDIFEAIPKKPTKPILEHAFVGKESNESELAVIGMSDAYNPKLFKSRKVEGVFPDYKSVIPSVESAEVSTCWNLDLLAPLLTTLASFKSDRWRWSAATFHIKGPEDPVRIDMKAGEQKVTAVFMPMCAESVYQGGDSKVLTVHPVKTREIVVDVLNGKVGRIYSDQDVKVTFVKRADALTEKEVYVWQGIDAVSSLAAMPKEIASCLSATPEKDVLSH